MDLQPAAGLTPLLACVHMTYRHSLDRAAQTDPATGDIYIDPDCWKQLPDVISESRELRFSYLVQSIGAKVCQFPRAAIETLVLTM